MSDAVWETDLPGFAAPKRGKVRDLYDLGDCLLLVATDRLSAYDHVLRPPIPGKGKILTQLSNFWFGKLADIVPHHLLATDPREFPERLQPYSELLRGRSVLVKKARVIPFECVARGYLAGSAFREYKKSGMACGYSLPAGLQRASRLPEPLFTPATKAEDGHDENIDFARLESELGRDLASRLRELTLRLYARGAKQAEARGLILADTKFEFGELDGELLLIDEALTPDSSRYWEAKSWTPGKEPISFDKQYVRNWLDETDWDKSSTPPALDPSVVEGTQKRYREAFEILTGEAPQLV